MFKQCMLLLLMCVRSSLGVLGQIQAWGPMLGTRCGCIDIRTQCPQPEAFAGKVQCTVCMPQYCIGTPPIRKTWGMAAGRPDCDSYAAANVTGLLGVAIRRNPQCAEVGNMHGEGPGPDRGSNMQGGLWRRGAAYRQSDLISTPSSLSTRQCFQTITFIQFT